MKKDRILPGMVVGIDGYFSYSSRWQRFLHRIGFKRMHPTPVMFVAHINEKEGGFVLVAENDKYLVTPRGYHGRS